MNVAGTWVDEDGDVRLRFDEDGSRLELRGKDCPDDRDDCRFEFDVRFARFGDRLVADYIAHDGGYFGTWPVQAFEADTTFRRVAAKPAS